MIWTVRIDGAQVGTVTAVTRSEAFYLAQRAFKTWGIYDVEPLRFADRAQPQPVSPRVTIHVTQLADIHTTV